MNATPEAESQASEEPLPADEPAPVADSEAPDQEQPYGTRGRTTDPVYATRASSESLSLLEGLLRLHGAEDVDMLVDAADRLARLHLDGANALVFLVDKGGSFHLRSAKAGATNTLVAKLSEALGLDVTRQTITPHRGRMAKIWLDDTSSAQAVSLSDFWSDQAGEETCWRVEKALGISQIAAIRLASPEELLGIALFASHGEAPDPAILDAIGHHLTVALTNLRSIEKARQFGTVDPIRWIPDRSDFMRQLSREVSRAGRYGHPVTLALMVVDNFDILRLEYGWTVANRLLRAISSALTERLRESDFLGSYRHNGFGVVMVQTSGDAALEGANRLREAAQSARVLEGEGGPEPECVVAIACRPEDGNDANALLLAAESRLLPKRRTSAASA